MINISSKTKVGYRDLATGVKVLVPTLLLSSYIWFSLPVCSQTSEGQASSTTSSENTEQKVAQPSSGAEKKSEKSHPIFLWKGTRRDQTVYLVGTIHVAKPNFYPLPQEIENASNESKILFVEADILQADKSKILETLKQQGAYRPPETLSKNLSPEARKILDEYLNWSGESIGIYDAWKPWVVAQVLTTSALRRAGFKGDLGIDMHLLKEAHAAKKQIVSLESVESQLKMIDSFDKAAQEKILEVDVLTLKDMSNELTKIADAWRNGDAEAVTKLIDSTTGASSGMNEVRSKVLDARNLAMIEGVEKSLPQSGVALVAVGAAHLPGANGLIELLRKKGFEVNQVFADQARSNNQAISFGGKSLQRLYYPEGHFRVMFPGEPEMHYSTVNGIRSVDYTYPEFAGNFQMSYLILPGEIPNPVSQEKFLGVITNVLLQKMNAKLISNIPFSNAYGMGSQVDCKLPMKAKTTNQNIIMRLRFQLAGRMLYIVGGQGTAPWINSQRLASVMNSLEIVPQGTASRNSTQTSNSTQSSYVKASSYARPNPYSTYRKSLPTTSHGSDWTSGSSFSNNTTDSFNINNSYDLNQLQRKVRQDFDRVQSQLGN